MITSKEVNERVKELSERDRCQLYGLYLSEAMRMNPLRTWTMTNFPSVDEVKEMITCLPPNVCQEIYDMYFPS